MDYIELQKKTTKKILFSLLGFVLMLAFIIPGAIILENDENLILGIIFVALGTLSAFVTSVLLIIFAVKFNKDNKEAF